MEMNKFKWMEDEKRNAKLHFDVGFAVVALGASVLL